MEESDKKNVFKKGEGGRIKGVPNKITATAKRILSDILEGREEEFNSVLDTLVTKSPGEYARVYVELLKRAIPQKIDLGNSLTLHVPQIDYSKLTDDELRTLVELQSKSRISKEESD